ncbi:MAG: WD40 repeat domain-containing protein [Chloroflexi bacterium]|nr:WD40 repeat domain-containing protein [Chloroflexota bacterium]
MTAFISRSNQALIIKVLLLCLICVQPLYSLQAQEDTPWKARRLNMSKNGRFLAVRYGEDGPRIPGYKSGVWIYDLQNLPSPPQHLMDTFDYPVRIEFSPNSKFLALGTYDWLTIFDIENINAILDLSSLATPIRSDFRWISFSPDSKYIKSFSDWWTMEHEMSIWHIQTGQRVHAVGAARTQEWIKRPWLSPDWQQFLDWSATETKSYPINEFDIERGIGQPLGIITKRNDVGTVFSPDSSLFALATWEGDVQIYETKTWTMQSSASLYEDPCGENGILMAYSYNITSLATFCGLNGRLLVWNFETNEIVFNTDNGAGEPKFTANDTFLVSGRSFSSVPEKFHILVWNREQDHELTRYPGVNPELHPNSELMAAIGPDGKVWIWNIKSKQLLVTLPVPRH